MSLRLIFIILLSLPGLYAQDEENCPPNEHTNPETQVQETTDAVQEVHTHFPRDWWSANEEMVINANCRPPQRDNEFYQNYLASVSEVQPLINQNINGVEFENESAASLQIFQYLTSQSDWRGRLNGQDIQTPHQINPECKKVACALDKIFGADVASRMFYLSHKHGFNTSDLSFINSSRVTQVEINSMIAGVEMFPAQTFPISPNKQLTRFLHNNRLAIHGEDTMAFASIAFYDSWSETTVPRREYVVFHELAHYIGGRFDESPEWLNLSGWEVRDGAWSINNPDKLTSRYGHTNPAEDFAESVASYRYYPQMLKTINPAKYAFIRDVVFDGLEFDSEENCGSTHRNSRTIIQNMQLPAGLELTNENLANLHTACPEQVSAFLAQGATGDINPMLDCIRSAILKQSFEQSLQNSSSAPYASMIMSRLPAQIYNNHPFQLPENTAATLTNFYREKMAQAILEREINYNYTYNLTRPRLTSHRERCEHIYNEYGYQTLSSSDPLYNPLILANHQRSNEFNQLFFDICIEVHGNNYRQNRNLTQEQIMQAIQRVEARR